MRPRPSCLIDVSSERKSVACGFTRHPVALPGWYRWYRSNLKKSPHRWLLFLPTSGWRRKTSSVSEVGIKVDAKFQCAQTVLLRFGSFSPDSEAMGFLRQITMSCPCALSRQVAGAGCRCWCWCCELAVHVVETGCWCWSGCRCWWAGCARGGDRLLRLLVLVLVPVAGARGGDRLLVLVLGAGRRCWCWCCELAVHVVETGCWCWCRVPVVFPASDSEVITTAASDSEG